MQKTLRRLCWVMGVACVLIGLEHLIVGPQTVPDTGDLTATDDSQNRFFSAIFAGYGIAWVWAARQSPIPADAVRLLAAVFLAGGIARLLSVAVHGRPHWFVIALTVVEFTLPPVFFWLTREAGDRARALPGGGSTVPR
ncbi:DUF4345 domain-containing protein [Nocardia flavorosea]|uniref:DUF4345 domain-containing protein n=1 Tax=Nocardia flavorosea TaxID=53429 RepID=A0A846YJF6_9NOCA|nr:DUF4345 domain-containing protein [Nocardia flavorosea]NKY59013.1 DUF4345 domain-containing protein [Nocardia flavorosea]